MSKMKLFSYFALFLAALYAPSANAAYALPANVKALKRSVLKLLRDIPAMQNKQGVVDAVVSMHNLVETFLMPHLTTLHNDDYEAMQVANLPFEHCKENHNSYYGQMANLSAAHFSCRGEEADLKHAMDDACGDEQKRKSEKFIAECNMFANVQEPPVEFPGVCDKKTPSNQGEALRLANYFFNLRDSYIGWDGKCKISTNESTLQNASCDNLTTLYANKSAECDQKQIDMDAAACYQYRQGDCQAFTRCWEQATDNYIDFNRSVKNAVLARKAESEGLQKILCYLKVLNNSYSTQPKAPSGLYRMTNNKDGTVSEYNFVGNAVYVTPASLYGWQGYAIWQTRSSKTSSSEYASSVDYPFEVIGSTDNGQREVFSFNYDQIQLKHYNPNYFCDIGGVPINDGQVFLAREQVGLARQLAQEKRTQLACETFIAGQHCPVSHCVWRQQKCEANCSVFKSAVNCPDVRCAWDANNARCEDSMEVVCGADYIYSHNGYWGDIYTMQQPFGLVPQSKASTIDECRSACDDQTGCAGYSFGTDEFCRIYDHIAEVEWIETPGQKSPACKHWTASWKVTNYIGSVCGDANTPACDQDRWNDYQHWDHGVPNSSMDAVFNKSGTITAKGNETPIYIGRLTIGHGADLVVENQNAVIGCASLVFEADSVLQNCQDKQFRLPPIKLIGGNVHFEATCMGSAGSSTTFYGISSVSNSHLTVRGGNQHSFYLTGAGFFDHFTALCHSAYSIHARAEFSLGTGGVTIATKTPQCTACPILNLDVINTMEDDAVLELNCKGNSANKIFVAQGVNQKLSALVVGGTRMDDGVYDQNSCDFVSGGGSLLVGHVEEETLCEETSYDTSGLDIISLYFENHAPYLPSQPLCMGGETWPRPGTAEYVQQEYDPLPEDAPARDCQSVCCKWCNYYECPGGLYFENASCTKEFTKEQCCDVVGWKETPWVVPVCETSCGKAAQNATRTVSCVDAEGTIQNESACLNKSERPPETKAYCEATGECAICQAGFCSETGSYLKGCGANGGFDAGTCAYCTIADGYYATGVGGVDQDNCPVALCSDRAVCAGGMYLSGCGNRDPGQCTNCQTSCIAGFYADGCTGMSSGTCKLCDQPSGSLAITSGISPNAQCDFVQRSVADNQDVDTATDLTANTPGASDFSTFNLDTGARLHREVVQGTQIVWIRLTQDCGNFDVKAGWMSTTIPAQQGKTYKVAVEASWWPMFGPGLKGDLYCQQNAASVLQFQASGAANEDWFGANITACFDEVTHYDWKKVWFDFTPAADGVVTLTFKESKLSCLSVKSVTVYEI